MAGGKFKKPQRGGGRTFSRRIVAVHTTRSDVDPQQESSSSSSSSDTDSETEASSPPVPSGSGSMSMPGQEPESVPTGENSSIPDAFQVNNPNQQTPVIRGQKNKLLDMNNPIGMSRREREAAEREAANKRYWTLHQQGKTDEAKADLARLAIIRKQREEAAAQRLAEAKAKEDSMATKAGLRPPSGW
ncbi:casein kinase substrate phosphoprotein PP28-domain-containing protein [Mortierella sp. GBAus27b]|nr:casein kinase substrate phosphoprotein PP28-domain-containing protein [Mortierella sp. GBAus27b]